MSDFTHHNTCINLLDLLIETDPTKTPKSAVDDKFNLLNGNAKELDDNVQVKVQQSLHPLKPRIVTSLNHPKNVTFIPIMLDDRRHLAGFNDNKQ